MRLLVLSLLALGAHAHSIAYRTNLLAYAPARGEFPVENGLAQGYVRYLDNTGAERLVAYNYPEPLYGIRRLSVGNDELVNPLLRTGYTSSQDSTALFRAWCEQRYNALRLEMERLRAEGKKPSANMLSQFEPLEMIVKTSAYEAVPGLSPEVQRARDEHLRIWNEARLEVLRAEHEHLRLTQTQPQYSADTYAQLKSEFKPQEDLIQIKTSATNYAQQDSASLLKKTVTSNYEAFAQGPQPVQDTPEVLRAREEHLKQYNEAVLRQTAAPEQPIVKTVPGIQQQLPEPSVPFTPVIRTSLPDIQEAQQSPQPVQETPEVKLAREQHLALLQQAKLQAEDKVADITDKIRYEEREQEAERLRELQQRREEQQQAELLRVREEERIKEETRLLEAERLKLQEQEQQRIAEEAQRLKTEELEQQKYKTAEIFDTNSKPAESSSNSLKYVPSANPFLPSQAQPQQALQLKTEELEQQKYKTAEIFDTNSKPAGISSNSLKYVPSFNPFLPSQAQPQQAPQAQAQQQLQQNGFFLRIQANQPAVPTPTTAFVLPENNPFLVRYTQNKAEVKPYDVAYALPIASQPQLSNKFDSAIPYIASPSIAIKTTGLTELEQATQQHFRAHEIALEQLRLANEKNPWKPDCN